jgi:hypothetical protein
MEANTTTASFSRTYPYVKTYWTDSSGHWRYSLTSYHGNILTAVLAILLTYALGRLLFMVNFVTPFFLYRRSEPVKTILDDQVTVLSANIDSPSGLLMYLLHLGWLRPFQASRSSNWLLGIFIAISFCVAQIVTVVWPGIIIRSDPIPYSPGTCGYPRIDTGAGNFSLYNAWVFSRYEQESIRYRECVDLGDHVTCPGPAGGTFSWEVIESEPGYCWFGQQYCYNGSTTITQRATITPRDLGTLRKSPMSLTVMTECSHLNNSEFIEQGNGYAYYRPRIRKCHTYYIRLLEI